MKSVFNALRRFVFLFVFSLCGLAYPDEQKTLPKRILVSGCNGVELLKRDYGIGIVHENITDQAMMLIVSTDEKTALGTNKHFGVTIADVKYVNNEFNAADPGLFQASFLSGGGHKKSCCPWRESRMSPKCCFFPLVGIPMIFRSECRLLFCGTV